MTLSPSSQHLISLPRPDGIELIANYWPQANARAHVHIAHGMAEHGARYAPLASVLNANGYSVTASDHRGHGETARKNGQVLGDAGSHDVWNAMVSDLVAWWQHCLAHPCQRDDGSRLPLIVLGHSLGGFMTLQAASVSTLPVAGIALSAIGTRSRVASAVQAIALRYLPSLPGLISEEDKVRKSPLVEWASFGRFNNAFKPNRTGFDWLSRDNAQVDAYIADPFCGKGSSIQLWADFLAGVAALQKPAMLTKIRADAPMLLLSGSRDPVGGFGKGMPALAARLRRAGVVDVKLRMFHEARHELLNETNAAEVSEAILQWLNSVQDR
jgi:alpha-beta hydrolase superfamily lysophospholipase